MQVSGQLHATDALPPTNKLQVSKR